MIDTNILVSSMKSLRGNEATVLKALEAGQICPCFSQVIPDEDGIVLRRHKFAFDQGEVLRTLTLIIDSGVGFTADISSPPSPDPTDTKFIACALASHADYLLTGNRRHFSAPFYGTTQVVNATELLSRLNPTP